MSTDRSSDRVTGNEIGGLTVSLPVHIDDPLRRVELTALATSRAKQDYDLLGPTVLSRMMAYLPTALAPAVFRWHAKRADTNSTMNIAVSNVPGPRERGHLGGAQVEEIYSMGILSAGSALNITVWSYVDQAHISVLSDDRSFADIHEVTDAMSQGLIDIRVAARLSPDMQQIGAVMAPGACEGMTGRRSNGIDSFVQEAVVQLAHRC